jgi:hypothetical protein
MATLTFPVPHGADKKKLEALIEAQLMYERLNEARLFFVHVLAIIGAPVWLCLGWPALFSHTERAFILALWGTCGVATLAASVWQRVWYHRRAHRLTDYETKQREGTG